MLNRSEELLFWTCIMKDHSEFFLLTLSHNEDELIKKAFQFKEQFTAYEKEVQEVTEKSTLEFPPNFMPNVIITLLDFINLKRLILKKLLKCEVDINLPPAFINHQINEAMEFYRSLCIIMSNNKINPPSENVLLHKIWLPDAAGHASSISCGLDPTEYLLIKSADEFKKKFEHLFVKATELGMMLDRTELSNGVLGHFNEEVKSNIVEFINYLEKIEALRKECRALGYLKPLLPNHMLREERYYLSNINIISNL